MAPRDRRVPPQGPGGSDQGPELPDPEAEGPKTEARGSEAGADLPDPEADRPDLEVDASELAAGPSELGLGPDSARGRTSVVIITTVKSAEVIKRLGAEGWILERVKGSHHLYRQAG